MLIQKINKPALKESLNKIKKMPPKNLKSRVLGSLISKCARYRDIYLKEYLRKWNKKTLNDIKNEFHNKVFSQFLNHTFRKFLRNIIKLKFIKWHLISSILKNTGPNIEVFKKLNNAIVNHCFRSVIPKLKKSILGVKSKTLKNIHAKLPMMKLNLLRHYLNRYKKLCSKMRNIELSSNIVKHMGTHYFNKFSLHLINNKFQKWKNKANMLKYLENEMQNGYNRAKILASSKMFHELHQFCKKKAQMITFPRLIKHLLENIKSRSVKSIINLHPKLMRLLLKNYFKKWIEIEGKLKINDLRNMIFLQIAKNVNTSFHRFFLKKGFNTWFRNCPKNTAVKMLNGYDKLLNGVRRKYLKNIVKGLGQKIDKLNLKDKLFGKLNLKHLNFKNMLRRDFYKWRKLVDAINTKDLKNLLSGKILIKNKEKFNEHFLRKRLNFWRQLVTVKLQLVKHYDLTKNLTIALQNYCIFKLRDCKKEFLERTNHHKSNSYIRIAMNKLIEFAYSSNTLKLRFQFNLWRLRIKDLKIRFLKQKLWKFRFIGYEKTNEKTKMLNAVKIWMHNAKIFHIFKITDQKINNVIGFNKLVYIVNKPQFQAFNRIKQILRLDNRGKITFLLFKKLNRSKYEIGRCFEKWRRVVCHYRDNQFIKNLSNKLLFGSCRKLGVRLLKEFKLRCWNKWRKIASNVQDKYFKKIDGINILQKVLTKAYCSKGFNLIDSYKNYKKCIRNMLPSSLKLVKNYNFKILLKRWSEWKKHTHNGINDNLISKIITSLSKKTHNKTKQFISRKAFLIWRNKCFSNLSKRLIPLPDAARGLKKMKTTIEKKFIPDFLRRLPLFANQKQKKKGLSVFLFTNKAYCHRKLLNYFKHWWRIYITKDAILPSRRKFGLLSLKRRFVKNYILQPLEFAFYRWQKNMEESYKNIIKGGEMLNKTLVKYHRKPVLSKICSYVSVVVLKRALLEKVIPKCNKLYENYKSEFMRKIFTRWNRITHKKNLQDFSAKIFHYLYKNKFEAHLRKNLKKWQRINSTLKKAEKRKPIDLNKIREGEEIYFKAVIKKLLGANFIEKIKKYGQFRFLRSIILQNSKFHRKHLRKFIYKWKQIVEKLKAKTLQARLFGKLLGRMSIYHKNKIILAFLKKKFNQFREMKNLVKKKAEEDLKKAIIKVKVVNNIMNIPYLLIKLSHNKMRHIRNSILFIRMKKHGAMEKRITYEYIKRWKEFIKMCLLKDMKNKILGVYLKNYQIRLNKISLKHRFAQWKDYDPSHVDICNNNKNNGLTRNEKTIKRKDRERILMSITVGIKILTLRLQRTFFAFIYKKTHLLNRKIPDGISLNKALLYADNGLVKNVSIKSILMRQRFRRWKEYVARCKVIDLKNKVSNSLIIKKSNLSKLWLRKANDNWKKYVNYCILKDTETEFRTNIIKVVYAKNLKMSLFNKFNHWKDLYNKYVLNLAQIYKGLASLRDKYLRQTFKELKEKMIAKALYLAKKERVTNTFKMMLITSSKGQILYFFNKFKNACQKMRTIFYKHQIIRFVITKYQNSLEHTMRNKLHEKLLRWYFHICPKTLLQRISYVVNGCQKLEIGLIKKYAQNPLGKIRRKAIMNLVIEMIYKWGGIWDKKSEALYLKKKYHHWLNLVIAKRKARKSLHDLFSKYNISPQIKQEKYGPLLRFRKFLYQGMESKVNAVLKIQRQFKKLKANSKKNKLSNILIARYNRLIRCQKIAFKKWRKPIFVELFAKSALVIQKFVKKCRDRYLRKKKITTNIINATNYYLNKMSLNKLNTFSRLMNRKKICFKRWKYHFLLNKRVNAVNAFNAIVRGFITRKLYKILRYRKLRLNDVVMKLFSKYLNKKKLYFNNWKFLAKIKGNESAATILQDYIKKRIQLRQYLRANKNLFKIFKKHFVKSITKYLTRFKLINKNRGKILVDMLEKNIRYSFLEIKDYSRMRGQILCLRSFYPRLIESLRKYWTLFYVRKWSQTVENYKLNKLILLQNKIKGKLKIWKLKTELRKYNLLKKYSAKLSNERTFIGRVFLKIWNKKAAYLTLKNASNFVQSIWNGNISRKTAAKEVSKLKSKNLFRKLFLVNTKNQFSKMGDLVDLYRTNLSKLDKQIENRYSTNNLLNQANDIIRNSFLYLITKKKYFLDCLSFKKEYFTRWKKLTLKYDDHAKILQSKYRQFRAKKLLKLLLRIKEKMLSLIKKHAISDKQILYYFLLKWKIIHENYLMEFSTKTLQKYIRTNLIKKRLIKTQRLFRQGENALVAKRINNFARMQSLKKRFTLPKYIEFLNLFKRNYIQCRIKDILLKSFYKSDTSLGLLYLKSKIQWWNKQTHKINAKRLESSIRIQSCFRRYKMRKLLNSLIDKKTRYLKLFLKLTNQMEVKKAIYFQLWSKLTTKSKYEYSSRVLQNYMNYIQDKINRKKTYIKFKSNYNGLMIMKSLYDDITRENFKKLLIYSKHKRIINLVSALLKIEFSGVKLGFEEINRLAKAVYDARLMKVTLIRDIYKMYKQRKGIMSIIFKIKKLRNILSLAMDKTKRTLNIYNNLWKRNVLGAQANNSAKKIGSFIRKKLLRYRFMSIKTARNALKYLFTTRRDRNLKDIKNISRYERFNLLLMLTILNNFKSKIFYSEKIRLMNRMFRLPHAWIKRMLTRSILRWAENTQHLIDKEKIEILSRNGKNLIFAKVKKMILDLYERTDNKKVYFYHFWKTETKKKKIENAANTINNWVNKKYRDLILKRKWFKLVFNYSMRHYKFNILNIYSRMKQFARFRKIYNIFDSSIKLLGFNHFKLKVHLHRIEKKMEIVLNNTKLAEKRLQVLFFWSRWRHVISHYRLKDAALEKIRNIYETRQKIDDFRILSNAFIIKKINKFLTAIHKKRAFDKITLLSNRNDNLFRIGKIINKGAIEIKDFNVDLFVNGVFRIYTFRILNKFCLRYNKLVLKTQKENFDFLLENINNKELYNSKFNYQKNRANSRKPSIFHDEFTSIIDKEKFKDSVKAEKKIAKNQILYVMPFFVNYIKTKLDSRRKYTIDKFKPIQIMSKFLHKVEHYCRIVSHLEERNAIHMIQRFNLIDKIKDELKIIFRRYRMHRFQEDIFKPTVKFIRLLYFIRVLIMHNESSDLSFQIQLVRRWRISAFIQRSQKIKLEEMQKNMQLSYQSIAEEIFGSMEESSESSGCSSSANSAALAYQMEGLSDKMGIYSNLKLSLAKAKKIYLFGDLIRTDFKFDENEESHNLENNEKDNTLNDRIQASPSKTSDDKSNKVQDNAQAITEKKSRVII